MLNGCCLLFCWPWPGRRSRRPHRPRPRRRCRASRWRRAGRIVFELDTVRAPITAGNFLRYVDARRYDGSRFYRAMQTGETIGLIQGGIARSAAALPADRA